MNIYKKIFKKGPFRNLLSFWLRNNRFITVIFQRVARASRVFLLFKYAETRASASGEQRSRRAAKTHNILYVLVNACGVLENVIEIISDFRKILVFYRVHKIVEILV